MIIGVIMRIFIATIIFLLCSTAQAQYPRWRYYRRDANARRSNVLDRMEARLDKAERYYGLKQRENELIRQEILPPKKKPSGIYLGKKYESYAEFKLSDDYKNMIINRDIRLLMIEIDKKREKLRYDAAVRYMAKRARMDPINRVFHDQKIAIYSRARSVMGQEWWEKYMLK